MPYNFFTELMELNDVNGGFKNFLEFSNIKNTAIFGAGQFGRFLAKELLKLNINITCYIENNIDKSQLDNIPITPISNFDKYSNCTDLIIVSISHLRDDFIPIYNMIKKKYNGLIISIETLTLVCKVESYAKMYSKFLIKKKVRPICVHCYTLVSMENVNLLESIICNPQTSLSSNNMFEYLKFANSEIISANTDADEYIEEIRCSKIKTILYDGQYKNIDVKGKFVNVKHGIRYTTDNPDKHTQTVHFLGSSLSFGLGVEDKYTLPSCLQRNLNKINDNILVINNGIRGIKLFTDKGKSSLYNSALNNDDIVILLVDCDIYYNNDKTVKVIKNFYKKIFKDNSMEYIDLYDTLNKNRSKTIYADNGHFNFRGNQIIADEIYKTLVEKNFISHSKEIKNNIQNTSYYTELNDYIDTLKEYKTNITGNIGSIVMNCNPFTNGHRYLIEHAASQVDYLYIFIVEEDKSFFKFSDRIKLVKEGVKDIKNCTVIPSGKFIISALTFPEYFSKESNNDVLIDATSDLTIFSKHIAPALNISIRYVGDEPTCSTTNRYNNTMKEILPKYGIELRIIKRLNYNDSPISASIVRKLLNEKNFDEIKTVVPESTYNFLISNFK